MQIFATCKINKFYPEIKYLPYEPTFIYASNRSTFTLTKVALIPAENSAP